MAHVYRKLLSEKLTRLNGTKVVIPMKALNFTYQRTAQTPELNVSIHEGLFDSKTGNSSTICDGMKHDDDTLFNRATIESKPGSGKKWINLSLNPVNLMQTVLGSKTIREDCVPTSSETMVIEFSSPNIAKPFHAGHLRSTVIGNFLSNLNEFLGHRVLRLNYLGDWGTQFGYLALGVRLKGLSSDDISKDPIKCLYDAYVLAHEASQSDPGIHGLAMDIFSRMEHGDLEDIEQWQNYRSYTITELENLYRRLGVSFTSYEWESQYGMHKIANVLDTMEQKGILKNQSDGRKVVQLKNGTIPLVKSDGTGMYLLRDVAALMDRHRRYGFQRCFYVVENGQNSHFTSLTEVAHMLRLPYANDVEHIKFGRIHGMSTRRGKVVFLKDILQEAQQFVQEKQRESSTTKANAIDNPYVCDVLGTSAVIINDLKQRRMKDYDFDWSKILRMEGDSGIKLQYTHCRLSSLLRTQTSEEDVRKYEREGAFPLEPEAVEIVCQLANFQPVCYQAQEAAEACILVAYLFRLCKSINLALKTLPVKQEVDRTKRHQRILLFYRAKHTLHTGMELLGLRPLNEM